MTSTPAKADGKRILTPSPFTKSKKPRFFYSPKSLKTPCGPTSSHCLPRTALSFSTCTPQTSLSQSYNYQNSSNVASSKPFRKPPLAAVAMKVKTCVSQSKYYTAFRHILKTGKAAQRAFDRVVKKRVQAEVQKFKKAKTQYPTFDGRKDLQMFSWEKVADEFEQNIPTLWNSLVGAMPRKQTNDPDKFRFTESIIQTSA